MSANTFRTYGGVTYGVSAGKFGQAVKAASKLAKRLRYEEVVGDQLSIVIVWDSEEEEWRGMVAAH